MKLLISFTFYISALVLQAAPDGAQLFTTNCAACHMPDQKVVGPSLVEIRTLYNGKPKDFVKWCVAPQKKRADAIEMPSMVHVGEEGLLAIYAHIMKASEGLSEKVQNQKGDPFVTSPVQMNRPQVQRIFMPDAGPAAIAIALDNDSSLCWDAGECRLRYAWIGGFIDGFPYWKGNGSELAKVIGTVKYVESESPFGEMGEKKFLGYRMENGLPLLRYQIGGRDVTESFTAEAGGKGFKRKFAMGKPPTEGMEMRFPSDQSVSYASDKGTWSGSLLKLTASDAEAFTITISYK